MVKTSEVIQTIIPGPQKNLFCDTGNNGAQFKPLKFIPLSNKTGIQHNLVGSLPSYFSRKTGFPLAPIWIADLPSCFKLNGEDCPISKVPNSLKSLM